MIRRSIELRDDHAAIDLVFGIGRRTVRISLQSTRSDNGGRRGGFFTRRGSTGPATHFDGPNGWPTEFDMDDDGYVEIEPGHRVHFEELDLDELDSRSHLFSRR